MHSRIRPPVIAFSMELDLETIILSELFRNGCNIPVGDRYFPDTSVMGKLTYCHQPQLLLYRGKKRQPLGRNAMNGHEVIHGLTLVDASQSCLCCTLAESSASISNRMRN